MATEAPAHPTAAASAIGNAGETDGELRERIAARRVRFRDSVSRLSDRAQSVELLKLLLVPGAVFLVGGFGAMFLGWYGAARSHRSVEQVPYMISGGLVGLGLVLVGALLLASAFWMTQLQRFGEQAEHRRATELRELEERLREELVPRRGRVTHQASARSRENGSPSRSTRSTQSTAGRSAR